MPRVIIVEDSQTQAQQIQLLLEDARFETEIALEGRAALELVRKAPPDLVLTDLEMPVMNGLELVEAVHRDFPWVPVILMTAHGSEEIASLALCKGAASYVPKAYLDNDIVPTMERILELTKVDRHLHQALHSLSLIELQFVLTNDHKLINPILGYQDDLLMQFELCDVAARMRVGVALQEALLNAIYHGNLEVSSQLRQTNEKVYHDLVQSRCRQPAFEKRRVHFHIKMSAAEAVYIVRDDGQGFDPSTLPDPTDPVNLDRVGGRGLLLIRTFMDHVAHNQRGNEITMIKRPEASP